MESEIKILYRNFFNAMFETYEKIINDDDLCKIGNVIPAKLFYLKLKEKKVEDIESLRGCLNTLEKEFGMEVTEDDSE